MRLALIAAVAANGVIGRDGALPWRLPDDLAGFRARTLDGAVLMGRRTFASLPAPLARRLNLVLSRDLSKPAPGATVVPSLDAAIEAAAAAGHETLWVIGGAEVYALALPRADELVLTHVDAEVEGDTRFPALDPTRWRAVSEETHPADPRHAHAFRVVVYARASGVDSVDIAAPRGQARTPRLEGTMHTTARELMSTDLTTLGEHDDFISVDQVIRLHRVRHVPVVREGKPIGIVTHRDLMRAQAKLFARAAAKRTDGGDESDERVVLVKVSEIMTTELATCGPDTPADDLARRMLTDKIGCVLVVEDGKLIGLVTETDVLSWAVEMMAKLRFEES